MKASATARRPGIAIAVVASIFVAAEVAGTPAELDPPGSYAIEPPGDSIRIPFEVIRDEIRLVGSIGGREVRMLVDNGALWDELLFFGSPRVDALDLRREKGAARMSGAGAGEPVTADLARGIELVFAGLDGRTLTFHDQAAIVTPYEPGEPNPWEGSEGQVSSALFEHFAVTLDFDERIMTLVPQALFEAEEGVTEVPITPRGNDGAWTLPAVLTLEDGRRLDLDAAIDLGWDDPLAINFGGAHQIPLPPGLQKRLLGYGAQGPIHGYYGTVPGFEVGGYRLSQVTATFSTVEEGGSKVGEVMVGLGIFSRFEVTFDYARRRILLRPNRRFGEPFEVPAPPDGPGASTDG